MTPKEELIAARALLVEKGWTQRQSAIDEAGNVVVELRSPRAVAFCALGALWHGRGYISRWDEWTPAENMLAKAVEERSGGIYGGVAHWQDAPGRTKKEVLAAYDRAIELAAAESSA